MVFHIVLTVGLPPLLKSELVDPFGIKIVRYVNQFYNEIVHIITALKQTSS